MTRWGALSAAAHSCCRRVAGEEHAVLKLAERVRAVTDRRSGEPVAQLPDRNDVVLPRGQLSENVIHWSL